MPQLVKTKRQANCKDFKRFGAFKGLVEQKNIVFNSFVCKLGFFGTRRPLKRSFHSLFKLAHSCQKKLNLRTNSLNKLLFSCIKQYFSSPKTAGNNFIFRKRRNLSKNGIKVFDHIFPDKLTLKFLGDHSLTPCIYIMDNLKSFKISTYRHSVL
jgi:hypothetical protein